MLQDRYIGGRWFNSPKLIRLYERDRIAGSWSPERTFPLEGGVPPHIAAPEQVRYLSLYESTPGFLQSVPEYLKRFINLEGLHLPSYTIEAAKPDEIPTASLRYLIVFGGNCTLPWHLYLPRLEHIGTTFVECLFKAENVPALRDISTRLDRHGKVLAAITSLPSLVVLAVGPVRSEGFYQAISTLGLEHLGMSPSRNFRSLHGIERVATLRTMRVVDFKRVDSIEPLAQLPLLEEIFFQDCKGLPSLASLASCPSLKSLRFLGCGPLQWEGTREILTGRSVQIDDEFT